MAARSHREATAGPVGASMTLLTQVTRSPLDPAYAEAAARREALGQPRGVSPSRPLAVLAAVLVGLLLVTAAVALRGAARAAPSEREALIAQIGQRTSAADAQQRANNSLRAEIQKIQSAALGGDRSAVSQRLADLGIATGTLAVTGPGVTVVVDDATGAAAAAAGDPRQSAAAANGRVQDRDLQAVVNGLWAAGAEAISFNDQRLTTASAIRSAGDAILVDFRPLAPPYTVRAIGAADSLGARFADGYGGRYLQALRNDYGVRWQVTPARSLSLPAGGTPVLHSVVLPTTTEVTP